MRSTATGGAVVAVLAGCLGAAAVVVLVWWTWDWAEEQSGLPEALDADNRVLGTAKLRDGDILEWAQREDLPETFWDDFNYLYGEMARCSADKPHLFDLWGWKGPPAGEAKDGGGSKASRARSAEDPAKEGLSKKASQSKAADEEDDSKELFDVALVLGYAALMGMGLGKVAALRQDEDPRYDTLHIDGGKTDQILPEDRRRRRRRARHLAKTTKTLVSRPTSTHYQGASEATHKLLTKNKDQQTKEEEPPTGGTGHGLSSKESPRSGSSRGGALATAEEDPLLADSASQAPSNFSADPPPTKSHKPLKSLHTPSSPKSKSQQPAKSQDTSPKSAKSL